MTFEQAFQQILADVREDTKQRQRQATDFALALTRPYAELRWLEKDYDDEKNGDWPR